MSEHPAVDLSAVDKLCPDSGLEWETIVLVSFYVSRISIIKSIFFINYKMLRRRLKMSSSNPHE